jgi:hypothetical protein
MQGIALVATVLDPVGNTVVIGDDRREKMFVNSAKKFANIQVEFMAYIFKFLGGFRVGQNLHVGENFGNAFRVTLGSVHTP